MNFFIWLSSWVCLRDNLRAGRTFPIGSVARIAPTRVDEMSVFPCTALSTVEFGTSGFWCKDEA
jgi:hypothetical protein